MSPTNPSVHTNSPGLAVMSEREATCRATEQTLVVSERDFQALLDLLDRPESDNPGLADLFSRRPVWVD